MSKLFWILVALFIAGFLLIFGPLFGLPDPLHIGWKFLPGAGYL